MNIAVEIHYITDMGIKALQRGSFPKKGRSPEKVAYNFWREIKMEMQVEIEIEKIIIDGEDKTEEIQKFQISLEEI